MSRPKWPIYLILWVLNCCRILSTTPSLCQKSVIGRYNRVNFRVKVNLGQSSCYFDLRSNFQLDLSRSKSICFDVSQREKHDGAYIIPLSFLVRKVICEKRCIIKSLSFLLWPDLEGSRCDLKWSTRVALYSTPQGFVWSLSHSFRGEMAWGVATNRAGLRFSCPGTQFPN